MGKMVLPNLKCSPATKARHTFSRMALGLNGSTNETRRWFDKEGCEGVDQRIDSVWGLTFAWNPSAHLRLEVT